MHQNQIERTINFYRSPKAERASGDATLNPYLRSGVTLDTLQIIFKIAERCNLACPYCYYFYAGDDSAATRPPVFKVSQLDPIVAFLAEGVKSLSIQTLSIVFHGGEPMLMKPAEFQSLCSELRARLGDIAKLQFGMQTNGTLISEPWLEVLHAQEVSLGISIDGPAKYHDLYRYDHAGRGSHSEILASVELAKRFYRDRNTNLPVGTISVMGHAVPVEEVYDHIVREVGLKSLGFLLPDRSHDRPFEGGGESALTYGRQLAQLFDCWLGDDSDTSVREIREVLRHFQLLKENGHDENYNGLMAQASVDRYRVANQILVIQSDGSISVDDSLIPALKWRSQLPRATVRDVTLLEYPSSDFYTELFVAMTNLPAQCQSCRWKRICRGGALENRFSEANGFDNPSVYCEGLQYYFGHVEQRLKEGGYPEEQIEAQLKS